jgi:pimeloyl-ACP methyl ester carboxylesterase
MTRVDDAKSVNDSGGGKTETSELPNGLPTFEKARRTLPEPRMVGVRPGLRLEVLHLPGPPPPLVFIHGGLGNLWNPYPQLVAFQGERESLTYSLAGNGHSDKLAITSLQGHVDDLKALLKERNVTAPILIGWSYGAAVALEYAKHHPVMGLLITGGAAYDLTPFWERPMVRLMMTLKLYKRLPGHRFIRLLAKRLFHPETPKAIIDEMLEVNPMPKRDTAWRTVTDAFWGYDGREDLNLIQVPALVVHGETDKVVKREAAEQTADLLPDGVFFRLAKTGHVAPVERPLAYNRLVEALIAGVNEPETWPEPVDALRDSLEVKEETEDENR